jgi:hypothetical protein
MSEKSADLGPLAADYGPSPAFIQRAVIMTVLSFLFFLGTMSVYYVRQNFLYFILASAFLVIYLISLVSFFALRKNHLSIYQNGLTYKKTTLLWRDVSQVNGRLIEMRGKDPFTIPGSMHDAEGMTARINEAVRRQCIAAMAPQPDIS